MNEAYQRLRDGLPERRAPGANAVPTEPRALRAWVDALPRANPLATQRQLLEALSAMAEQKLEGAQRLLALEALRPTMAESIAAQHKLLQGSTFPLPQAKVQAADQIQAFQRGLALGYRLALVELCAPAGAVPFLKGTQVALALQRAILHASRDLAASYYMYRTPRTGVWATLNALYRFAQSVKLEDKAVDEPLGTSPVSPHDVYAQALLLAIANPYRFSQREQAELWPLTRELAAQVELVPRRPGEDAVAVAQQDDRGPGYLPEERDGGGALLWLDLAPLRAALEGPLQGAATGAVRVRFRQGGGLTAPAELLRRMRAGWGHAAPRGYQRLGAAHSLDTVIGLAGLHFHLAGQLDFDSFMRQVRGVAEHDADSGRVAWAHNGVDVGRTPMLRARVLDQSLGGYRLSWTRGDGARARVGELVGVALPGEEDERDWMVGVIRWLRHDAQDEVEAGVELLARRAQAVGLRPLGAPGGARAPLRAIQIEGLRMNGDGELRFLAPAVLDAHAARIEVARVIAPDAFEPAPVPLQECSDILVLESAGDYLLLAAQPLGHA